MGSLLKEVLSFDPRTMGSYMVTLYEKRLEALKKVMPARGVMGYVGDEDVQGGGDKLEEIRRYYLTQYVLSPIILLHTPRCKQVIGNFQDAAVDSQTYREWNVEVLAKFDGVVWLLNRNVP